MVSCPTLRSACRNARSSADRSGRCPFQGFLATFQEVVAPRGQPMGLDPELA
jgi:hypothetical protein